MNIESKFRISWLFFLTLLCLIGCSEPKEKQVERFLEAAKNGDVARVRSRLANGVDVNARKRPDGWTALHYAAAGAHLETVRVLLGAGADVSASGTLNQSQSGTRLLARPLIVAQTSMSLTMRLINSGGTLRLETGPDDPHLPTDAEAEKRYQEIISLLQSPVSKHETPKSK